MMKWVSDEAAWEQAKAAARAAHAEGGDDFWFAATEAFRRAGGHIHHNVKSREQGSFHQVNASWSDLVGEDSPVASRDNSMVAEVGADSKWELDKPASFQWMPGGVHTIRAHWRGEPIELTVVCDKSTADRVQANFAKYCAANPRQTPFGCVEHHEEEAALRFPADSGRFEWDGQGVKCTGLATELGARNVNGRIHSSWSPSFVTDADYVKAAEWSDKMGLPVLTFPAGSKGSRENPAMVLGIVGRTDANNPSVGSLTNKPAFRAIQQVRSSEGGNDERVEAKGNSEGAKKGWQTRSKTFSNGTGETHVHEKGFINVEHEDDGSKHYHVLNKNGVHYWHAHVGSGPDSDKMHAVVLNHAKHLVEHKLNDEQAKSSEADLSGQVKANWSDDARKAAVEARKSHARCKSNAEAWKLSADAHHNGAQAHESEGEHVHESASNAHRRAAVAHEVAGNKAQSEEHTHHAERHSNVVTRMRAGTDTKKGFMSHADVKSHVARRHAEGKTQEEVERELGLRLHPNHGLEAGSGQRHHMATGEFHTTHASEAGPDMESIYAKVFGTSEQVAASADDELDKIYAKAAGDGGASGGKAAQAPTLDDIYAKCGVAG